MCYKVSNLCPLPVKLSITLIATWRVSTLPAVKQRKKYFFCHHTFSHDAYINTSKISDTFKNNFVSCIRSLLRNNTSSTSKRTKAYTLCHTLAITDNYCCYLSMLFFYQGSLVYNYYINLLRCNRVGSIQFVWCHACSTQHSSHFQEAAHFHGFPNL